MYAFFKHVATQFWLSGAGPPIPQPPSADPDDPQEEQFYPVIHPEKLERNVMLVVKLDDGFTNKVRVHEEARSDPFCWAPESMTAAQPWCLYRTPSTSC